MRSRRWQWQRQRQRLWLCAASSTFLLFSPVVGASPLYTVCRHTTHTHTHTYTCDMYFSASISLLCMYHTHTHRQRGARHAHACEHAYIQLLHAPVCVCVCVTDAALAESDQTQTKVSSAVAAGWQRAGSGQAARVPLQAATAHYAKAQPNLQTLSRAVSLSLSLSFPLSRAAPSSSAAPFDRLPAGVALSQVSSVWAFHRLLWYARELRGKQSVIKGQKVCTYVYIN